MNLRCPRCSQRSVSHATVARGAKQGLDKDQLAPPRVVQLLALDLECLAEPRHLDSAGQLLCQAPHGRLLAMNQEGRARSRDGGPPGEELAAVGMGRKAVDGVDAGPHGDLLTEQGYLARAIDEASGERALGGKADEDDARLAPPQIVAQMVA